MQVYDNLCIKGFRNIPLDNAFDQVYAIGQGTKEVLLSGFDNTECLFRIELYREAALSTPSDASIFTVVAPVFSGTTVTTGAKVLIISADTALAGSNINVFVEAHSDKNSIDHDSTSFMFSVTFVLTTCSTSLTSTATMSSFWATTFDYKITDSALSIPFHGISNNDCRFTATLIDTNTSLAPPSWISLAQPTFILTG